MNRYIIPTLCIFLTSCATNIKNIEPVSDMASIVAFSDSSGNILLPLSSTKRTRIEEVDGKKVSDFWNSTERINIKPGTHSIVMKCHILQGGINVSNKITHEIIVEKARIYIFKAYLDSKVGCTTKYELYKT